MAGNSDSPSWLLVTVGSGFARYAMRNSDGIIHSVADETMEETF